jgi:non-specific protein-tyrosine kinase
VELKSFVAVIRSHVRIILACAAVATAAALVVSLVMPRAYEASTKLIVGPALSGNVNDLNQLLSSQQVAQTYAAAAETQQLAQQVISDLGLPYKPDELLAQISTDVNADTPIITVKATDHDPGTAAAIANAVAQQLIARSKVIQGQDQQLQTLIADQIKTLRDQIDQTTNQIKAIGQPATDAQQQQQLVTLQAQLVQQQATLATLLQTQANGASDVVSVLDPAVIPTAPASPRLALNVILGLVLGTILGLVVAFALASLDDTFKDADDVEGVLHLPVLGILGRLPEASQKLGIYRLVMLLYPRSGAAEAFRTMRTNVEFADIDSGVHSLLVTSPSAGDGKSTVATNLALAFAQAGRRTILVDADLRRPAIHDFFDLSNTYGLTSLIRSMEVLDLGQVLRVIDEPNLRVLTSGPLPPNPAELLGSNRMHNIVERLEAEADLVIFDSPPAASVTDAAVLASLTDGTILIVAAERTRRGAARTAQDALARVGGRVLGVVMNRLLGRVTEADYDAFPYEQPGSVEPAVAAGGASQSRSVRVTKSPR